MRSADVCEALSEEKHQSPAEISVISHDPHVSVNLLPSMRPTAISAVLKRQGRKAVSSILLAFFQERLCSCSTSEDRISNFISKTSKRSVSFAGSQLHELEIQSHFHEIQEHNWALEMNHFLRLRKGGSKGTSKDPHSSRFVLQSASIAHQGWLPRSRPRSERRAGGASRPPGRNGC